MAKQIIGTMSGTSMDGIDAAFLSTDGINVVKMGASHFQAYSKAERSMIVAAIEACKGAEGCAAQAVIEAETMITNAHAKAIKTLIDEVDLSAGDIALVGFHGHTILHAPHKGTTVQIGDGEGLANQLGIPVSYDFRSNDVAAGGQGAPLVPVFHKTLLGNAKAELPAAIVNIGGVANVTIVTSDGLIAFDTGPGNAMIDDWMKSRTSKTYDQWGRIAGEGRVNEIIVGQWLENSYFSTQPPKSLDRNAFDMMAIDRASLADGTATLTAFTARSIAQALAPYDLKTLYVSGGGAHNRTMMRMLKEASGLEPLMMDALGFDGDFLEAQAFAYLAARVEADLPLTYPTTTGVKEPTKGGKIARPT
ncbi:MAG: anhydro-N-acetylmuramic acid kinase [Hyphomicrobiales bacterium]